MCVRLLRTEQKCEEVTFSSLGRGGPEEGPHYITVLTAGWEIRANSPV